MRLLITSLLVVLALGARAQEPLDAILAREHVANWLVCGPFPAEAAGGVISAALSGAATLGTTDYMQPAGGAANVRPEHLLQVAGPTGPSIWQEGGATSPQVSLAPLFGEQEEGVGYAAFYALAGETQTVLFELHTLFGARVWHNGLQVREQRALPLDAGGVDEFIATFVPGPNLLLFQLPVARLSQLASAAGQTEKELASTRLVNRDLLSPGTGFEFALRLRPIEKVGDVYVVPRLEALGVTRTAGAAQQRALVTLFNTARDLSPQMLLRVSVGGREPQQVFVEPLPPATLTTAPVFLDTLGEAAGTMVPVRVNVREGEVESTFTTTVEVLAPANDGVVHVLPRWTPETRAANQSSEVQLGVRALQHQGQFHAQESGYGYSLGPAMQWEPLFRTSPETWAEVRNAAALGEVLPELAYSAPDHRLVTGETLLRNLRAGAALARARLGAVAEVDVAVSQRGIAPQWPQVLRGFGVPGVVSYVAVAGLPPLFLQAGPDGSTVWHRRKAQIPPITALETLRVAVLQQSSAVFEGGFRSDGFIAPLASAPAYLANQGGALAAGSPSVRLSGGGQQTFMRDLDDAPPTLRASTPVSAALLTGAQPTEVASHPALKQAHTLAESTLLLAERFSTLASALGATFPGPALDQAWKQVLYWSTPERLGAPENRTLAADVLAGYRDAAEGALYALRDATGYLAERTNTLGGGPAGAEILRSIVVYNPSAGRRSDVCRLTLTVPAVPGLRLTDDGGTPVAMEVEDAGMEGPRVTRVRMRFVAEDVPGLGYKTFYLTSGQGVDRPRVSGDNVIQTSELVLIVDPETGDVMSLTDKASGEEFAAGPLNRAVSLGLGAAGAVEEVPYATAPQYASGAQVESETSALRKTLRVRTPFLGGTLVRELTLHEGLSRVDARLRLEGGDIRGRAVGLSFAAPFDGSTPVFGERFGVSVGARRLGIFQPGAQQPAHRFAAFAPGDHVRVGLEQGAPIERALIIHGEAAALREAAEVTQRALARRGIPSRVMPQRLPVSGGALSDDTWPEGGWAAWSAEPGMRIVLGSPEQNSYCADVLRRLPADQVARVAARAPEGTVMLALDPLDGMRAPARTLLVLGPSAEASAALAEEVAESIGASGRYVLPPAADLGNASALLGETGLAVTFRGTALASVEEDGTLFVVPAMGTGEDDFTGFEWEYSVVPIAGTWRDAGIASAAVAASEPFVAVSTDLHAGDLPPSGLLAGIEIPNFVLTAVEPAGWQEMPDRAVHALDGVVVRGYETAGRTSEGWVRFFSPVRTADRTDLRGRVSEAMTVAEGGIQVVAAPNEIVSMRALIRPNIRAVPAEIGTRAAPSSVPGAYWRHNTGAAPESALSLVVREDDAGERAVSVVNLSVDQTLLGHVEISTGNGWSVSPTRVPYALRPGDFLLEPLVVAREAGADGGFLATVNSGGTTVYDAAMSGPPPVEMRLSRTHAQVKAELLSTSSVAAHGYLDLVAAPWLWPEWGGAVNVAPRGGEVLVPPQGTQVLLFRVSDPDAPLEGVLRLSVNGYVTYAPVPVHGNAQASEQL